MGVTNATLLVGATIAASGGTVTAFVPNGAPVNGGVQVVDSSNPNAVTRASITCKTIKTAALDVTSGLFVGKIKRQVQLVRPKVLSSGRVVFPLIRIELELSPENTEAENTALLNEGAQLLFDADFLNFWKLGSIS